MQMRILWSGRIREKYRIDELYDCVFRVVYNCVLCGLPVYDCVFRSIKMYLNVYVYPGLSTFVSDCII